MPKPIHLKIKKKDLSPYIITVGDPERAGSLAENILEKPEIINKYRGFLSYTGYYDGMRISIVTHGIGMPSAAIVLEELTMLGAKAIVRLGTTGALKKNMNIGDIVIATSAGHLWGGTIGQYAGNISPPNGMDPFLTQSIMRKTREKGIKMHEGPVISSDAFYAENPESVVKWSKLGFIAVEMECSVLSMLGWMKGYSPACMLLVTDNLALNQKGIIGSNIVNEKMITLAQIVSEALLEYARQH